jgi:hypothetical protein
MQRTAWLKQMSSRCTQAKREWFPRFAKWVLEVDATGFVWQEIKKYESKRKENKSTYWVIFELIWCVLNPTV